ncbi:zinc finger protein 420-like [Anopheles nili]|uniref:zinc finger protein 420-like n=1 Tax=Anopheles nili TaxID=185578 RepID=UPI00237A1BAE|nr:zinc finger protein 420-like [Anopheles nili]
MVVICRICLSTRPRMISIHSPVPEYDQKTLLAMLLSVCLPLNQREMLQGFPEQICCNCKWKLLSAYDLYETTLASDEHLRAQKPLAVQQQGLHKTVASEIIDTVNDESCNDVLIRVKDEEPDDDYEELYASTHRIQDGSMLDASDVKDATVDGTNNPTDVIMVGAGDDEEDEEEPSLLEEAKDSDSDPMDAFFNEHYQFDEENGNHGCGLCKQEFVYKSQCRMHITQKHNPAKPFKCDVCFVTLTSHLRLVRHKIVAHGAGQIKCENVKQEPNTSTGEMTYACPICGKTFTSSVRFKRHKNVHVVHKRPFKCEVCLYRFATKAQLTQHAKVHDTKPQIEQSPGGSDVGEYACDRCDEVFATKRPLTMHLKKAHQVYRVPGGSRPDEREKSEYVCIICKATFARETVLNTHLKMHELMAAEKEKERRVDLERLVKQELQQQLQQNAPPLPPLSPEVVDRSACVLEPFALGLVPVNKSGSGSENNNISSNNNNSPIDSLKDDTGTSGPSNLLQGMKRKLPMLSTPASDMAYVCPVCDMEFDEREPLKKHQKEQHSRLQVGIVSSKQSDASTPTNSPVPSALPRLTAMPGLKLRLLENAHKANTKQQPMEYADESELLDPDEIGDGDASSLGPEQTQFQCELCHKTFLYNCYLTMHMRKNHDKSKPYGCKVCHYRFGYRGTLLRHQLIHSSQQVQPGSHGSIIFKCRICSAKFLELKQLNVHLKTHRKVVEEITPDKKVQLIQCNDCPQIFRDQSQLWQHVLKEHRKHESGEDDLYEGEHEPLNNDRLMVDPSSSSMQVDHSGTVSPVDADLKLSSEQIRDDDDESFISDLSIIKMEPNFD